MRLSLHIQEARATSVGSLGGTRPIVSSDSTIAYTWYSLSADSMNTKSIPAMGKKHTMKNIARPMPMRRSLFHTAQVRRVKMTRGEKKDDITEDLMEAVSD